MTAIDTALLILRLWLAIVMLAHGINHARSIDGTASWFESKGFRQPRLNARMSAAGELAIGLGIAGGLLTSFAAAGLIGTMTVAFGSIHRFAGFFVFKRPDEGYEYVATLAIAALALAIVGPGAASIDNALAIDVTFDGWTGLIIALGGLAAGVAQLAVFWRRPAPPAA
ncbi:MAG: DoxX family protein [Acidimicrobiia bacterium]|nr:DoxX family protein [Acidimicrobiia bacterium]